MAAKEQVFNTVELLEAILYHQPIRDLLLTERVCKQWQSVIKNSPKLQHTLFFRPVEEDPLFLIMDGASKVPNMDRAVNADAHLTESGDKRHWVRENSIETSTVLRNPLLDPLFQFVEQIEGDFSLFARLPSAWRRQDASWRKMLPCQPAVKTSAFVELTGLAEFWCAFYSKKTTPVFCTTEVRIGQVFDQLEQKYGQFPYGQKQVHIVGLELALERNEDLEALVDSSK